MEQQERFVVSMIGFALTLDKEFRMHFLRVCGLDDLGGIEGWDIAVEPNSWSDLALRHKSSESFAIVEFKIGTSLKKHQNPACEEFSRSAARYGCRGYGVQICRRARRDGLKHLRYVTIERKASWSNVRSRNKSILCRPVEWKQFVKPHLSEESNIEAAVYDTLSQLGASVFAGRRMKQMKLKDQATLPLKLLTAVLDEFDVGFRPMLLKGAGADAIGFDICKQDFPKLWKAVAPTGNVAGWFGYESNSPLGPRRSVWFYCQAAKKLSAAAQNRIERTLIKAGFGTDEFVRDGSYVSIYSKGEDSNDDLAWFTTILSALNN